MTTINIKCLPVDAVHANDYNPNHMIDSEFSELVSEVRHLGRIPKPVIVRRDDDGYVVVDGEHGWRAAKEAGLPEIPCEVLDIDDFEARRQTFKRNQHGTHDPAALGRMFREMMEQRGLSQRALATEIEVSEGTVRNALLYAQAGDMRNSYAPGSGDGIGRRPVRQIRFYVSLPQPIGDSWLNAGGDPDQLFLSLPDPHGSGSNLQIEPKDWSCLSDLGLHAAFETYKFSYARGLWDIWAFYERHHEHIRDLKAYLLPTAMAGFGADPLNLLPIANSDVGPVPGVPPERWQAILNDAGDRLSGNTFDEFISIVEAAIRLVLKDRDDRRDYSDPRMIEALAEIDAGPDYIRDADLKLEEKLELLHATADAPEDMLDTAKRKAVEFLSRRDEILRDPGSVPRRVLIEYAGATPIELINSTLQRLQMDAGLQARDELLDDRGRLTDIMIEIMSHAKTFRDETFGKTSAADIFRQRLDNLPWPEFRLLACFMIGETDPSISYWLRDVQAEHAGRNAA